MRPRPGGGFGPDSDNIADPEAVAEAGADERDLTTGRSAVAAVIVSPGAPKYIDETELARDRGLTLRVWKESDFWDLTGKKRGAAG